MDFEFYRQDKEEVFQEVASSEKGLSNKEAKERLLKNGKNRLNEQKARGFLIKFFKQFKDYLILILIISVMISVIIGAIEKVYTEFINAGVILFVILLNAFIGVFQEAKADKAMEELKNMTKPEAKVLRNGRTIKVKTEDLVLGDVVLLEAGDSVPADLRIIESANLKIEESTLTGESEAVEKSENKLEESALLADRCNMAYMGTTVVYGRGKGVVVATAMATEIGKIAYMLHKTKQEATPLTQKVKKTSIVLGIIVLVAALFIAIYGVAIGDSLISSLTFAIAIAVCAVPEGLPAGVTITMALGVNEMSKQRAIVKNLSSVETLGSTEVICSDKTGTLTLNKMVIKEVFTFDDENLAKVKTCENGEDFNQILGKSRNINELMNCMLLCNDSELKFEESALISIGDPTEVALSEYGYKWGIIKENVEGKFQRVDEIPFDSERKLMTTLNKTGESFTSYTKGAVDNLLQKCTKVLIDGRIKPLTLKLKEEILNENARMAKSALRVLGFSLKYCENSLKKTLAAAENEMVFIGLVGMMDPPREEVFDAIKTCKKAGILPIMITGDHKDTAFAIAKELGIASYESEVITGQELEKIPQEEFCKVVTKYKVYARVNPEHKVRVVEALKKQNKVVAMTGDGVNDAPSIKRADIGIGMGITGTDVTKSAADVILTDDNFATIVGAVKEGRRIYDNILRIIQFLLGTSLAELVILVAVITILRESFFTPVLILWINIVSDSLVSIALGLEKAETDVMDRRPKQSKTLLSGLVGVNLIYSSIIVSAIVLGVFFVGKYAIGLGVLEVTTMCYLTLVFCELFHAYNLKSFKHSIFSKELFKNKWLNWAFLGSAFFTIILVLIPAGTFTNFLGITNLNWMQWLISIGAGLLIVPFMELEKLVIRLVERNRNKKRREIKNR